MFQKGSVSMSEQKISPAHAAEARAAAQAPAPQPVAKHPEYTYVLMMFDGLCISGASVVVPLLREHYGLAYDLVGTLLALLSVGNLLSSFICGFLPRRLGIRKTALIFTFGIFLGYLMLVLFHAPFFICLAFLIIGLGKGSSMNNATVAAGSAAADKTKSTNFINATFALGSLMVPVLYTAAGRLPGWKGPLYAFTFFGLVIWIMFHMIGLSSVRLTGKNTEDRSFLRSPHFWLSVAFLFFIQCSEITVVGWVVTYFKDAGILSGSLSNWTVTVFWLAMLIGRLLIVFVIPQESPLRTLPVMSAGTCVTYLLLLTSQSGTAAVIFLFLYGLTAAGLYPTVIAQSAKNMNNASVGVMLPIGGIGAIVTPYLVGAVAEQAGIEAGMACPMVAILLSFLCALLLRKMPD